MSYQVVASVDQVRAAGAYPLVVDGRKIALFVYEEEILATDNVCTHQYAILTDGFYEAGCVECPLHQGVFDVRSGQATCAPATDPIRTYAVSIEDGNVMVDLERESAHAAKVASRVHDMPTFSPDTMNNEQAFVVVGGGLAGVRAALVAREQGFAGAITVIGDEPVLAYDRPPLSKGYLLGEQDEHSLRLVDRDALVSAGIEFRTGSRVREVRRVDRQVVLEDGERIRYDTLLMATGSRPRTLAVPGADSADLLYLRNLDDANRLARGIERARTLLVVGGGFIGLEVASCASARGKKVTVVDREACLLSRVLPNNLGRRLEELASAAGVTMRTGTTVERVEAASEGYRVLFDTGPPVEADAIVVGIGAIPNDELAENAGLGTENGVLVDEFGRSSDPHIFAAGDVARRFDPDTLSSARLESWHNARHGGERVGYQVAGRTPPGPDVPWFWSDLFGTNLQMLGAPNPAQAAHAADDAGDGVFVQMNPKGVVGAVFAFDNGHAIRTYRERMNKKTAQPMAEHNLIAHGSSNSLAGEVHPTGPTRHWPGDEETRIPDWVYTDSGIYQREVERIFHGDTWNYVALESEIPEPGCYVLSHVGPTPVVVVRQEDDSIAVFENRCAHRAAEFCREKRGKTKEFVCPYHQWTYDLSGRLIGVPFRRGVAGKGGMPKDFRAEDHGAKRLHVTSRGGVVFASFSGSVESLDNYLGTEVLKEFDATFDGRRTKVLGYYRNTLPGNWKLYHENLKDPYHATLLHAFLVTFGLLVAGNKSAMICDPSGRHGVMASAKTAANSVKEEDKQQMRSYQEGMRLADPRIMDFHDEFDSEWSVTMITVWPNLIVQREMNTLGVRQIVPKGPNEFVMHWTMFGFEDDDEEMTRHRLRQGNLMGPSGFLGLEDNEAMKFVQDGMLRSTGGSHLVALDPETPAGSSDTLISESAIRAMYRHWRDVILADA